MKRAERPLPAVAILLTGLLLLMVMNCAFDRGNRSAASENEQAKPAPAAPAKNDY